MDVISQYAKRYISSKMYDLRLKILNAINAKNATNEINDSNATNELNARNDHNVCFAISLLTNSKYLSILKCRNEEGVEEVI